MALSPPPCAWHSPLIVPRLTRLVAQPAQIMTSLRGHGDGWCTGLAAIQAACWGALPTAPVARLARRDRAAPGSLLPSHPPSAHRPGAWALASLKPGLVTPVTVITIGELQVQGGTRSFLAQDPRDQPVSPRPVNQGGSVLGPGQRWRTQTMSTFSICTRKSGQAAAKEISCSSGRSLLQLAFAPLSR